MTAAKEKAIRAQAQSLGIDPQRLLRLPADEMQAASYFPADPKAVQMRPFPGPRILEERVSHRTLRIRDCDPPRLTTKS